MGRGHLRRVVAVSRVASAAALALGMLVLGYGGGRAQAADTYGVSGTSWYWADQVQSIGVICPPDPLPQDVCAPAVGQAGQLTAPDVPAGDMAVNVRNNGVNKVSALTVDLSAVPSGSNVANAILRLVEDPTGGNSGQTGTAPVVAAPADYYARDQDARPISEAPKMAGPPLAAGTRATSGTDGVWTFDVTAILNGCLNDSAQSCAIGLRPPDGATGTYEVVWYGPRNTTSATATAAQKPSVTASVVAGTSDTTDTTFETTDTTPTESVSTPTESATPEGALPSFLSTGSPLPAPATPPTTAVKSVAGPTLRRAAKSGGLPPIGFYLCALGLAGLLGTSMVALGEGGEPVPGRRGSVLRTLERRIAESSGDKE